MSGQDQASGLRKWANQQRQQQQSEAPVDVAAAEHVESEMSATSAPVTPTKPKTPLMIVGLPGSGASQVNKVKARLGQWSALGRSWAGNPDDWDVRIVMAEAASLAQLRDEYSRWALWINSDADAFAAMFRTLRQLKESGGPNRLLALHEPHLPRQGLLDNLREAADYYLNIELLVLAR
ncbi:MAG TPA: hypothetical protein VLO13_06190 [Halomonas sp.]|nr:hypothetical protein [Halomonas sp.]